MTRARSNSWTELRPPLRSKSSRDIFLSHARALARAQKLEDSDDSIQEVRESFSEDVRASDRVDKQALLASGLVLADLATQGWELRAREGIVGVRPPTELRTDRTAEKARVRRQELVKRDAQLRQPSVQKFLRSMERNRLFGERFVSIFSLMRDGRDLATALRKATESTSNGSDAPAATVDPYLEFVTSEDAACRFTGLRLMDIWRYFRHTWTNQYKSVPGRTMSFLVRDRAAPFHPVIGIGALSSPVMQIRERDAWVGWHPDTFLARLKEDANPQLAKWLADVLDAAIAEIYVDDFLESELMSRRDLKQPHMATVQALLKEAVQQRQLHHRYVRSRDHKTVRSGPSEPDHWIGRARTHLFRSKRALALASYLRARIVLDEAFKSGAGASDKLVALASTALGREAIRNIVRKAKADRIGIAVADITVCGAVQPYNAILGGKLVAMMAASPQVVLEYQRRYAEAESEIASSMAGRPIIRKPTLVLLGTTSLYGIGSSQYNRIKIPCDRIGGSSGESLVYEELGHSQAFGTSQYSEETVEALEDLVQQSANGQRVHSIFGEGVSPKLRKIRQGLGLLGLPPDLLLRHHRRRVVYAVSLVRNLREYLLGIESDADYLLPLEDGAGATARIGAWWRERWLQNRIRSKEVLRAVEEHTLVRPIRHGARVVVPVSSDQGVLFNDSL